MRRRRSGSLAALLTGACLLLVCSSTTLAADTPVGETTFGGRIFINASHLDSYQHGHRSASSGNGVDLTRLYLDLDHRFSPLWSAHVTTDINWLRDYVQVHPPQQRNGYGRPRQLAIHIKRTSAVDTDLRRRKLRDKVPMTYVTAEPYIGHMGLGGVGDSKGLLESELRQRHIKWVTNARVTSVESDKINVEQLDDHGQLQQTHALPFTFSMLLPSFAGIDALQGIDGLVNPGGFVLIDAYQRNPKYPNIFAAGVCVAIPPVEVTPVPTGAPKTGLMIESMVSAIARNLRDELAGKPVRARATWNAMCLADMGDRGFAFIALPQIPPRNVTKSMTGKWVHLTKVAYEKYFLRKMRKGHAEPLYEKAIMQAFGIERLKPDAADDA